MSLRRAAAGGAREHAAHHAFGVAHRQAPLRDQRADFDLLAALREAEQGARVTHLELAPLDECGDLRRQLEQAQQVRDRGARTADGIRRLLVRDAELADEPLERARLFERVQVLALDVLDERHRDGGFVGHACG